MSNRFYQIAVVLFWLATTNWLVITKILPALRRGDPPNHHAAAVTHIKDDAPIVWDIVLESNRIGWAANKVDNHPDGTSELFSRIKIVDCSSLPILLREFSYDGKLQLRNKSTLDQNRHLQRFESAITTGEGSREEILASISGAVLENRLRLNISVGGGKIPMSIPIRPNSVVSNEMSPRGYMPPLSLNQQWTTYQISPFPRFDGPQPPIVAKVERYGAQVWGKRSVDTFLVVYRKDAGTGSTSADDYLGRMWVRIEDGMVLRQEVVVAGVHLHFARRPPAAAARLAEALNQDWAAPIEDGMDERAVQGPAESDAADD